MYYTLTMKIKLTTANIINVLGVFVILYLSGVLFETVARNYQLGQQMKTIDSQIGGLKTERDDLSYQIAYDRTESFQQREARSKLGLQLPGETEVVLPSQTPEPPPPAPKAAPAESNFQKWLDFLLGRADS